ncbi:MAG: hypothetical protein LUE27_10595 [Clostridia bacterium]|nr:hypothetical protein [Clostridia bacterium]
MKSRILRHPFPLYPKREGLNPSLGCWYRHCPIRQADVLFLMKSGYGYIYFLSGPVWSFFSGLAITRMPETETLIAINASTMNIAIPQTGGLYSEPVMFLAHEVATA